MKGLKDLSEKLYSSRRPISQTFTTSLLVTRIQKTDQIDDLIVSNNEDTEKDLATVVAALYAFFDKHPDAFVYATGSSSARTRLYRMGITRFYKEIIQDFDLYGQLDDKFYEFEVGKDYSGLLAQRKLD